MNSSTMNDFDIIYIKKYQVFSNGYNMSLYADYHPETSTKRTGFKDKEKAKETLKIIKKEPKTNCYYYVL